MSTSRNRLALLVGVAALLITSHWLHAAKVKVWFHHKPEHHEPAELQQAVITSEGTLRLARRLKPLADLKAAHVWDIVEDKQGNLFVATGDEGTIYKVSPAGETSVAFACDESQVFCLAAAADGSIYAGTGPSGLVVRIAPDGNARVIYDSPENYVWSLATDAKGETIFAGTGPKGRIYQLTPDGKATIFYTTKQEHVLCLTRDADGNLYAGTDKNGLVYRIDSKGKGFVVYQAAQAEVRSLIVTADGLLAGTSSPGKGRSGGGSSFATAGSSSSALQATTASRLASGSAGSSESSGAKSESSKTDSAKDKSSPAPSTPPPGAGENSVYSIRGDGTVRELFRDKALVLSLARQSGRLLVGTGMEGRLFEVDEASKEKIELARLDHGQIHCICRRQDGSIVLGTGDPGRLYVLEDRHVESGSVISEVLDAKYASRWGSLRWKADAPAGAAVSVAVRSGNVADPDETWSDWSAEETDPDQARITAPAARYLQYRVTLKTSNPAVSPAFHSIALRYLTSNQPPEVSGIDVPDLDAVSLDNPKKLKIKWKATDPNEDELTYRFLVRKDGWKQWVLLEEGLTKTEYEWDTTTTPAGAYQVKIEASDARDNAAEDVQTAEAVSGPVVVAHVPPQVTVKIVGMDGDEAIVEAQAVDGLVRLTGASFAVNGQKWINVFPQDGLFDSKAETFRFKTEALKPGAYVLVLRVKDAAGNIGSGDAVFTVQAR
jgi:hypothetical protein